jgi:hypothetical protein
MDTSSTCRTWRTGCHPGTSAWRRTTWATTSPQRSSTTRRRGRPSTRRRRTCCPSSTASGCLKSAKFRPVKLDGRYKDGESDAAGRCPRRDRQGRSGLASYYTERGESPGVWVGSGMEGIDGLDVGDPLTAQQMRALFGCGLHPLAELRLQQLEGPDLTGQDVRDVMRSSRSRFDLVKEEARIRQTRPDSDAPPAKPPPSLVRGPRLAGRTAPGWLRGRCHDRRYRRRCRGQLRRGPQGGRR